MPELSSRPFATDPDAVAKRLIQKAHNRDGLPEIAVGLTFLSVAALSYAQVRLPPESTAFKAAVLALSLLIPLLCFGLPGALRWVRRQFLIERVGYVEPKPPTLKQTGIGITLAVVMAGVLFWVVTRFAQPDRWVLAGTGLFGGALAVLCGRLPRFVAGGILMAATGIITACSGVSLPLGFAILFGSQGLVALISGGVVFLRFIRQPAGTGE